ncbi:MAG: hypothetical protein Q8R01_14980 [Ramlibacter sp.]|nr:hypothetical protein [Ramlibacter sp.]
MAGTFCPAWPNGALRPIPALSASWQANRTPARDIEDFTRLCGLPTAPGRLPPLFVHATSFRLQMSLLAHRKSPFAIWRVLQVRNQLLDLVTVAADVPLAFECRVHAHRGLPKGLEVDLHTRTLVAGTLVAESLNTFYVRGFPCAQDRNVSAFPPPPATESVAAWLMRSGASWRFGALTGDYNPVHMWSPYARLMGFRRAFFHPLRVVGHSLARSGLHDMGSPRRVDVWMKGPVYHDTAVELRRGVTDRGTALALLTGDDPRPAVVTQVRHCNDRDRIVAMPDNDA